MVTVLQVKTQVEIVERIIPALAGFQRVHRLGDFIMSVTASSSPRASPKRERSGRSGVFLAIKTAQDEVCHEFDTWHAKIPTIYGDLD